jgi:hypothetical protein
MSKMCVFSSKSTFWWACTLHLPEVLQSCRSSKLSQLNSKQERVVLNSQVIVIRGPPDFEQLSIKARYRGRLLVVHSPPDPQLFPIYISCPSKRAATDTQTSILEATAHISQSLKTIARAPFFPKSGYASVTKQTAARCNVDHVIHVEPC